MATCNNSYYYGSSGAPYHHPQPTMAPSVKSKLFAKLTISITGDFGPDRPITKQHGWILAHGGRFSKHMNCGVTHLVCSDAHYRDRVSLVKDAIEKNPRCKIVTFDWLEDSLLEAKVKPVKGYLMAGRMREKRNRKELLKQNRQEMVKKGVRQFEIGCQDSENVMGSNGYHIYMDTTGFRYDITLCQPDLATNTNLRYTAKLFESHSLPHVYAAYTRYSSRGQREPPQIIAPLNSSFDLAFGAFKGFFKLKTGRGWEERCLVFPRYGKYEEKGVLEEIPVPLGPGEKEMMRRLEEEEKVKKAVIEEARRKAREQRGEDKTDDGIAHRSVGWADEVAEKDKESQKTKPNVRLTEEEEQALEGYFSYRPPPEGQPRGILDAIDLEA